MLFHTGIRPKLIRKNHNYYSKKMFDICKWIFFLYLIFEVLLFTVKLDSFELAKCVKEEVRPPRNCSSFRSNAKLRQETRTFCWTNGLFKERVNLPDSFGSKENTVHYADIRRPREPECFLMNYEESHLVSSSKMWCYGLFLVLIVLHIIQRKVDAFRPIVNRLKERNINEYCSSDRKKLEALIMYAIKNLRFSYYLIVLVQIAYQGLLIASIFLIKLLLYGYQLSDDIDSYGLLLFANSTYKNSTLISQMTADWTRNEKDIVYTDQHFAFQLNRLFVVSWYVFLVFLGIYCVLLFARIIQYSLPTLRTKSILAFVSNEVNIYDGGRGGQINRLLNCLNSKVHIFYFLYEIAHSIDQHHLSTLLDQLDLLNDDSKIGDGLTEVKPTKAEYAQNGNVPGDFSGYQTVDLSNCVPGMSFMENPLYLADLRDKQNEISPQKVIRMPSFPLNVPAVVHRPFESHRRRNSTNGHQRSGNSPDDNPHSNNDQHSKDGRADLEHTHSNEDHHLDLYPDDVHQNDVRQNDVHQSEQPNDDQNSKDGGADLKHPYSNEDHQLDLHPDEVHQNDAHENDAHQNDAHQNDAHQDDVPQGDQPSYDQIE